jgi:hypothetical protein
MIHPSGFATQNAVIAPAATALPGLGGLGGVVTDQAPPGALPVTIFDAQRAALRAQKWLLVLSGVALVDLQGTLVNDWRRETLRIGPDLKGPLGRAVSEHRIIRPPGTEGDQYFLGFKVEQVAPFAAPSAVFNAGSSHQAGYAVDNWRLHVPPGPPTPDALSSGTLRDLFNGIEVDLAVRNKAAVIHRVSYNIALLGKIVYGVIQL